MAGRVILGIFNPALNANGEVDDGCTLTFYANGTTTLQSIYTGPDLLTPLSNPLSCDAAGRYPMIWGPDGAVYSVKVSPTGATPITYDNIALAADPNAATQYLPISRQVDGVLTDNQTVINGWNVPFPLTLPVGLDDGSFASIFTVSTNPGATMTLTLKKNATTIGTIAFNTSGVPTVTFTSQVDFVPADKFYVLGQASHDVTGAGLMLVFIFRLTQ